MEFEKCVYNDSFLKLGHIFIFQASNSYVCIRNLATKSPANRPQNFITFVGASAFTNVAKKKKKQC